MTDHSNLARPYSRAVFDLANADGELAERHAELDLLAAIAADRAVIKLTHNPRVGGEALQRLVLEVAGKVKGKDLSEQAVNLIKLLARNRRIAVLPAIARDFAARRAEAENVAHAHITTAAELTDEQRQQLTAAVQSSLARGNKVKLEFAVNSDLIGGAVVRAGDRVIDGSVRGSLEQLAGAVGA